MDAFWVVFGVVLLVVVPVAVFAGIPLWLLRIPLRVTVVDAARHPVPGAVVYGHVVRRYGGRVGPNGSVVEASSEEGTARVGRTGTDGVLATVLFFTHPWALHAEGPEGRSQPKRVRARGRGEPVVMELVLDRRG